MIGVVRSYHDLAESKLKEEYFVNAGVREGVYRSYYENGQQWEEVNYINGVREGFYKSYYSNGQLWEQVNYINGEREGVFTSYNRNGELEIEADYWVLESEVDN